MDSIALRLHDDKENGMENFFIKSTFFTYNLNYYSNKVSTRKGDPASAGMTMRTKLVSVAKQRDALSS